MGAISIIQFGPRRGGTTAGAGGLPKITFASSSLTGDSTTGSAAGQASVANLSGVSWSLTTTAPLAVDSATGAVTTTGPVAQGTYTATLEVTATISGQTITVSENISIGVAAGTVPIVDFSQLTNSMYAAALAA